MRHLHGFDFCGHFRFVRSPSSGMGCGKKGCRIADHRAGQIGLTENWQEYVEWFIACQIRLRMAMSDVFTLEEFFADGTIAPPVYVPAWARNLRALAAYLAFTAVAYRIDLGQVELEEILPAFDFD